MTDLNPNPDTGIVSKVIRFCLEQKLVVAIVLFVMLFWGMLVAPFDWKIGDLPRDPVR